MRVQLLGTAAAEGWPSPFCECPACQQARRLGGKDIRSRSSVLIDGNLKVDFGADAVSQAQRHGVSYAALETLIFTHPHDDHMIPQELQWIQGPFTLTRTEPLEVFGNAAVISQMRGVIGTGGEWSRLVELKVLEPFRRVVTRSGHTVLPLPADHSPGALLFRIGRDGCALFYGHDSGLYPVETLSALSEDGMVDLVLMDCTYGPIVSKNRNHMGIDGCAEMVRELMERNAAGETTRFVGTHFSHSGGLSHAEMDQALRKYGMEAGWDGLEIKLRSPK